MTIFDSWLAGAFSNRVDHDPEAVDPPGVNLVELLQQNFSKSTMSLELVATPLPERPLLEITVIIAALLLTTKVRDGLKIKDLTRLVQVRTRESRHTGSLLHHP